MSQLKKVVAGTYLFREGDPPDAMYLVKSGQLGVTKTKGNSEVTLAEIGIGSMVGEMAIFDLKPRSANVKALKDSEVVCLPYDALNKQLDAVPVWIKAILRTLNENLREANKKIKILESADGEQERYSPHTINKLLTIINLVGARFGEKIDGGAILVPANRLRNFTIQIFQEATNKMDAIQNVMQELDLYIVEELGEGKRKLTNKNPDFLVEFVDWHNEWLFKQDKDRITLSPEEVKILTGVIHFAKKSEADAKGFSQANLTDIQNESMKELGFVLKIDDVNSLIEKKLLSDKIMKDAGVYVNVALGDVEKPAAFWKFLHDLKRLLK